MNILLQSNANGPLENIIKSMSNGVLNVAADKAALMVILGVTGLACILIMIQSAIEIGKKFLSSDSPSFSFLVQYGLMMIALICYVPVMKTVDLALNIPVMAIKKYSSTSTNNGKTIMEIDKAVANENNSEGEQIVKSENDGFWPDPKVFTFQYWAAAFISFLYEICKFVIIVVRQYLLTILYILGPISLALSFIKKLEGSFIGFLKYYIVIHLWSTVVYTIDAVSIILEFNSFATNSSNIDGVPSWEVLVIQSGFILITAMTPKIADILVSGSQGGAFFSAATAYASKSIASARGVMGHRGVMDSAGKITNEGSGIAGSLSRNMLNRGTNIMKKSIVGKKID